MLDHKKLAVIHIVKKELSLSDQEYRDALEKVTGVRSAKYLDDRGFRKLMNYFARSRYYRINQDGFTFRQKMYIKNLKEQLNWQDLHFANFLKKYYKKTSIETLTKKEASKVIESLKNVLKHERMKKEGDAQRG
jgi:phage gp16-like protein